MCNLTMAMYIKVCVCVCIAQMCTYTHNLSTYVVCQIADGKNTVNTPHYTNTLSL